MFDLKSLDHGMVILCPDTNVRSLLITMRSIRHFSNCPCVAVVPKDTPKEIIESMKPVCEIYKGSSTYTSLINCGITKSKQDWNFVIFAGSVAKGRFWDRYSRFVQDENDILFPVLRQEGAESQYLTNFVDSTLNGLLLHKEVIKKAGKIPDIENINNAKLIWNATALESGCRFKGVLGCRIVG